MSSLQGVADFTALPSLPVVPSFDGASCDLGHVDVFHAAYEISTRKSLEALPAALFPSNPALVSWLVYRSHEGPFGPFTMLQTRLACVAGISKRALVVACLVDNERLRTELECRWGLPAEPGEVMISSRADRIDVVARSASATHLELRLEDPVLLPSVDVPILTGLSVASTPAGIRIVEFDSTHAPLEPALRGVPRFRAAAGTSMLAASFEPVSPVIGSFQATNVTLSAIRRTIDPLVPLAASATPVG